MVEKGAFFQGHMLSVHAGNSLQFAVDQGAPAGGLRSDGWRGVRKSYGPLEVVVQLFTMLFMGL